MSEIKYAHGTFVWRELLTKDDDKARRFYGELCGWSFKKSEMPGMTYWLVYAGEKQVGGLFAMSGEMPSNWGSYVSVADVDAAARTAADSGGKVLHGPMDIPGIGRMATVMDPQGAVLSLFRDAKGDRGPERPGVGEFCWEQLNTTDPAAASQFYGKVVGWQTKPFGASADTQVFSNGSDMGSASLMKAPPGAPAHWLTYVAVPRLSEARERAKKLGARVMVEQIDVPTVGSISVVQDEQGAILGLFEPLQG